MNWETILSMVWAAVNSPIGISVMVTIVGWVLVKVYAKKPLWKPFEGTIIAAIKYAEKAIPDDSTNKAVKRLDEALKYVLKIHREVENRRATAEEVAQLREGIQIVHEKMESKGTLKKTAAILLIFLMAGLLVTSGCGGPGTGFGSPQTVINVYQQTGDDDTPAATTQPAAEGTNGSQNGKAHGTNASVVNVNQVDGGTTLGNPSIRPATTPQTETKTTETTTSSEPPTQQEPPQADSSNG